MASITDNKVARRKTYNTDPIPGEVVAKMADAEVVSGVESGRIFYTALIGRKDPSGKTSEPYDLISAWWTQSQNQSPRDFSWPAKPDAKPDFAPKVDPVFIPEDGNLVGAPYDDPFDRDLTAEWAGVNG